VTGYERIPVLVVNSGNCTEQMGRCVLKQVGLEAK
jgi:hypothetical protein